VPAPLVRPHRRSSEPRGFSLLPQTLPIPRAGVPFPAQAVSRIRIPAADPVAPLPLATHLALHSPAKYIHVAEKISSCAHARSKPGSPLNWPRLRPQTPVARVRCPLYPSAPVCPPLALPPQVRSPSPAEYPGRESSSRRLRLHPGFVGRILPPCELQRTPAG